MALHAINGTTLADQAYRRISEAMASGALPPGSRLVMDALASELRISRTPVRDALHRLEREGLIEPAHRRGYLVRSVGAGEINDLYQARQAVEVFAARRAAELGETAAAHVAAAIAEAETMDVNQAPEAYTANRLVHRAVVEATGNLMLLDLFDLMWTRARALQVYVSYFEREPVHLSVREAHEPLLLALRDSPDSAAAAMRRHLDEGREITVD